MLGLSKGRKRKGGLTYIDEDKDEQFATIRENTERYEEDIEIENDDGNSSIQEDWSSI